MTNDARSLLGIPRSFKGLFKIYPPKIKDVLENDNFNKYLSIFTISQEDIEDQIFTTEDDVKIGEGEIPTPFMYLQKICAQPEYLKLVQEGFKFFTHEELTFIPEKEMFLLGNLEDIIMNMKDSNDLPILDGEDYFDFQNAIREVMGQEPQEPYNYNMHPKARRMKAKQRYRDKIKAKQGQKAGSFINNLVSICCMGIGITPLNIGEMSYASISLLTTKYQLKEKYDLDIRSLLAGASSKKIKPKYWMQEDKE